MRPALEDSKRPSSPSRGSRCSVDLLDRVGDANAGVEGGGELGVGAPLAAFFLAWNFLS